MKAMLNQVWQKILYVWNTLYTKLAPIRQWTARHYLQLKAYFKTHPKTKILTFILSPIGLFLFILLLIVWVDTPSTSQLRNIKNQLATEVYSADSVLLGRYFIQDRTEVPYDKIAPAVIDALVATEDVRFYDHDGVDFASLGRVLVKSIFLQDESSGGGSTITQQLAKNLYPRKNYWMLSMVINKLREVIIASRLELIYSKQEIITQYLNTVSFPDNTFGLQSAASRFFSTSTDSLSAVQAAVLVGSLKATHNYNPRLFPDRSVARRNTVLSQMVKYQKLDSLIADSLKTQPLVLNYSRTTHHQGLAPYFREFLKTELSDWCEKNFKEDGSSYNIYTDGLKVYTTLDSRMQQYAEEAVKTQMTDLQKQFFDHWGKERPWKGKESVLEDAIERSPRYKTMKESGMVHDDIIRELQKPIPMRLFTWQGVKEEVVSPIDSIIHHLQYLNAGFLVIEAKTGAVKAWVGGIDHDFFQYDHVKTSTKRQVGSIFKPIVYAQAVEEGIQPCDLISASQQTYIDKEGEKWTPRNMQNDYEVQYSMRGGLTYSVNTIAVKMIDKAGVDETISLARRMGITSELPDVPSIALGSSSISLTEMVAAYSCFANDGQLSSPFYITSIEDVDGKKYTDFKPAVSKEPAMTKESAQIVRQMLTSVVHEGTAARIRYKYGVYTDLAGKTGTTQANADGWFMGFSPELVMGSWVGADDPRIRFRSSKLGQGSNTALPIAGYFLKQLYADKTFSDLAKARFEPLPSALQSKLNCDLYELSEDLIQKISQTIFRRDSTIHADTLAVLPDETFLEVMLKRKMRMEEAQRTRDSIQVMENNLEEIGG